MATVAVIGSMLRSTTRRGHRSEMKGGTGDTKQSQRFLGRVYTAGFIGPFYITLYKSVGICLRHQEEKVYVKLLFCLMCSTASVR